MKNATMEGFRTLTDITCMGASATQLARGMSWFRILEELYSEPHRHYHTLSHIDDCLQRYFDGVALGRHPFAVAQVLAIWFHDAIYDPGSSTNEQESALFAEVFLRSLRRPLVEQHIDPAKAIILATRHDGVARGKFIDHVVDIDMAGFADSWETFSRHNAEIRQEFSVYGDAEYSAGRSEFLRGLLARPRIYHVRDELEAPARANIARHVEELEAMCRRAG